VNLDKTLKIVDVFAQLNSNDGKSSIPTHLQLKLAVNPNSKDNDVLQVSEQNDLSASDKQ
jgi:hypothetical protein